MSKATSPDRPIGVFDSGIGGLTVLRELADRLPGEDLVYLGDTARVPYGIRSPSTVIRYSFQNTEFLIRQGVKALVIACNTASAVSIDRLRERFAIPVLGVIEPGAKAAVRKTVSGRVGVIGTEATIRSGAYQKALTAMMENIEIEARACSLFVPLVEEGWVSGKVARDVVKEYLRPLKNSRVDTLVLGCTHYPLLRDAIGEYMGEHTALIDSAVEIAKETKAVLAERGLSRSQRRRGTMSFFVTDAPDRFSMVGERFLGRPIDKISLIDIV